MAPKLLTLALAVLMITPGCSWLFVEPLNSAAVSRGYASTCTTNVTAPVVDTILTGTNLASAVYVAGQDNVTNKGASVGLGLFVAGFWFASALYGYSKTSECSAYVEGKYQESPRREYPPHPFPYSSTGALPPPPGWNAPPSTYRKAPGAAAPAQSSPAAATQATVPAPAAPAASPAPQHEDADSPR